MDIRLHHRAQCGVNQSVALDSALAREGIRNDCRFEMPHAIASPCVPGMEVTLVLHLQVRWGECSLEPRLDLLNPFGGHGNTILNGFTLTSR